MDKTKSRLEQRSSKLGPVLTCLYEYLLIVLTIGNMPEAIQLRFQKLIEENLYCTYTL